MIDSFDDDDDDDDPVIIRAFTFFVTIYVFVYSLIEKITCFFLAIGYFFFFLFIGLEK